MNIIPIHDIKGKAVGKLTLDEAFFAGTVNRPLLHQVVLMYRAAQRRGQASTKTRGFVRGGGRKPWRQKGTGRARAGSIRSPLWRGGGVVFGPHPREFRFNLNKDIRRQAMRESLRGKLQDNELILVDSLCLQQPKTKELAAILKTLKAEQKPLIVLEKYDANILRAAGNIPNVAVKTFSDVNAMDMLLHKKTIFSKQALENFLVKLRK